MSVEAELSAGPQLSLKQIPEREASQRPGISPSLLSEIQRTIFPASIALAALAGKLVYFDFFFCSSPPISSYFAVGILAAIFMSLISSQFGLHSPTAITAGCPRADLIFAAVSLSMLLLICILYLFKILDQFSRGWFALWYIFAVTFVLLERTAILLWARLLQNQSRLSQRIAMYGNMELVERVLEKLSAQDRNIASAAVFSDDNQPHPSKIPISGGLRALIASAQRNLFDRVILAMDSRATEKLRDVIASLEVLTVPVQLSPDAMTLPYQIRGSEERSGLVLLDVQQPPLSERAVLVKTVMDYLICSIALIISAPMMLAIAIAIKLDSRGPVFFVQSRNGYNQRVIRVVKFRTMNVSEDGPVVRQAVRGDKRVTRVGRLLRRTSLDELPQLFNVLRGELSLVGPRPHAVTHNEAYGRMLANYASRHKVKPGITGWAQVNGFRGETKTPEAMRQRLELDLQYIRQWSPWLDIEILARTALVPFFDADAY